MIVLAFERRISRFAIASLKRVARELKRRHELPFDRFVDDLAKHNPGTARYILTRPSPTEK